MKKQSTLAIALIAIFCWSGHARADKRVYLGVVGAQFFESSTDGGFQLSKYLDDLADQTRVHGELLRLYKGQEFVLAIYDDAQDKADLSKIQLATNPLNEYALRLEKIKPQLSKKQWEKGVNLWADMLHAAGRYVKASQRTEFAGPLTSLAGLGIDASRVIWVPVLYITCAGTDEDATFGQMFVGTVPSVASDAIFAVPSSFMKMRKHVALAWDEHALWSSVKNFESYVDKMTAKRDDVQGKKQ